MLIDTHTHLYSEQFDQDIDQVIERANERGIEQFILPSIDSTYTQRMFDLEQRHPTQIKLMMGLHPTSVRPETIEQELAAVQSWLEKRTFSAVGEIGIDLYWEKTYLKEQQFAFNTQIDWAKKKKLPIVIHARNSFDEIFEVLEQNKSDVLYGVFHCFTGNLEQAEKAISYNMKLGIGGVVTFKNGKIDQFLREIPIEHIVLETDSPYLAPVPYRGKRNESSYLINVVEKLVDIYQLTEKEIAKITTKNANDIFGV